MPDLLSHPEEILCRISHFVHHQTIIDWACTCKVLSRCSLKALKAQSELRLVHDLHPITIPSLLRDAAFDPEVLCYVRSLDFWRQRETFGQWKSPQFNKRNPYHKKTEKSRNWPGKHHDDSYLDGIFYDDEELKRYRRIFSKFLHLEEPLVDKWMKALQSGSDEPLKLLLMVTSPMLTQLTIVKDDRWNSEGKRYPFTILADVLQALAPLPYPEWLCFQHLKRVSFGYSTEPRYAEDDSFHNSTLIAPLFLLPAIETIQFNRIYIDEADDLDSNPYACERALNRSTCQKLICKWPMIIGCCSRVQTLSLQPYSQRLLDNLGDNRPVHSHNALLASP